MIHGTASRLAAAAARSCSSHASWPSSKFIRSSLRPPHARARTVSIRAHSLSGVRAVKSQSAPSTNHPRARASAAPVVWHRSVCVVWRRTAVPITCARRRARDNSPDHMHEAEISRRVA
eukprot:2096804-Prymnesium_polylepis.3